jgi:hypothetical protein
MTSFKISPTTFLLYWARLNRRTLFFLFLSRIFLFNFTLVMFRKLLFVSVFDEFTIRLDNLMKIAKRHDSLLTVFSAI